MMKSIFFTFFFFAFAAFTNAQTISHIEETRAWYYIYDQDGNKIKTISTSQGTIVAYSASFYILRQGTAFYVINDVKGKRLACLSVSYVGEILSASGDTFTSRNGAWIYTWDKNGKKVNTRCAR